jgi:hypothetical protein
MDGRNDSRLDDILKNIEFPGNRGDNITRYLNENDFTGKVMKKAVHHRAMVNKAALWASFTIINLVILSILGIDGSFMRIYLSLHSTLTYFFFFFLGLSFLGGLCGLILNIDTSWMGAFDFRELEGYVRNLPRRIMTRFFK